MKLCIYWAEWTSLLARLSDMTFFACCCLWTGPKHFSKWILLFQLTQCAFYFKFLGRLMSRQILIWNMWRIPSLQRRKRRKHFWKVWMMWVTGWCDYYNNIITQQSAAKRWHYFVIVAGYNSCTLLGPGWAKHLNNNWFWLMWFNKLHSTCNRTLFKLIYFGYYSVYLK